MTNATDAKLVEDGEALYGWIQLHGHGYGVEHDKCAGRAIAAFAQSYAEEMVKKEREFCIETFNGEIQFAGMESVDRAAKKIRQRGEGEK